MKNSGRNFQLKKEFSGYTSKGIPENIDEGILEKKSGRYLWRSSGRVFYGIPWRTPKETLFKICDENTGGINEGFLEGILQDGLKKSPKEP